MGTGAERSRRSVGLVVACGLVMALALSVTAASLAGKNKTRKLSGSTKSIVDGKKKPDKNGKVSMKVTARNGKKPVKISKFEAMNLDAECQADFGNGGIETYPAEKNYIFPVDVPVNSRTGKFSKKVSSVEGTVKISGKVKKKGKKATGTLDARQTGPDSLCLTKAKFVAKK